MVSQKVNVEDVVRLTDRVQSLTEKLGELEYDKWNTKRIRNAVMVELGQKSAGLKVEPFDVMLDKVKRSAEDDLRRELAPQLEDHVEKIVVTLMKDFRASMTDDIKRSELQNSDKMKELRDSLDQTTKILEKKIALLEEDQAKKVSEFEKNVNKQVDEMKDAVSQMRNKHQSIDRSLVKLRLGVDDLFKKQVANNGGLRKVSEEMTEKSKSNIDIIQRIEKRLADAEFELSSLDVEKLRKDVNNLHSELEKHKIRIDERALDQELQDLWSEIEALKKGIKPVTEPKAGITTQIKKLEQKVQAIETKKDEKKSDLKRMDELERLVMKALGQK